jgi:hypothetical protein
MNLRLGQKSPECAARGFIREWLFPEALGDGTGQGSDGSPAGSPKGIGPKLRKREPCQVR